MHETERPDPDALLRGLKREEARASQGKLRIFFGFAPGVGKTYRMLQVARDLVSDQGVDVVIGVVETHGRGDTAAQTLGLTLLARRGVEYRGRRLEELDLDAALARRPKILLVDELAHTNAPGSKHEKRWQDVVELLDAGIDVFTTVNVQHMESLHDVVAQITHVRVREIVPDSILDRADVVELVDIAVEELLERLAEGKVYLPEQARRATEHFFKKGNLLALRELALRRTAQHVDEDVREYREQHGVDRVWPASERILVCASAAPSADRLIRKAARMATAQRCPWVAAYVEPSPLGQVREEDRERLEAHLRLAESLGGTVVRLSGSHIPTALLGYARKHNVTRIVVGKPTHSRLRDRLRGSLLDEIVRGSDDIDVHVIHGEPDGAKPRPALELPAAPAPPLTAYLWAALLVALTSSLAAGVRAFLSVPDLEILFVLAVLVAAMQLGRGPAIFAAGCGVLAYDFFFVPPLFTFRVTDTRYFLTFGMLFATGFLVSELTTRLRRQERDAIARQERTASLYALSRDLGNANEPTRIAEVVARHALDVFGGDAFVYTGHAKGELTLAGAARLLEIDAMDPQRPPADGLDAKETGLLRWAFDHRRFAGLGTDTLPASRILCAPLSVGDAALGVLALAPSEQRPLRAEQRDFLDVFCRQAAFAFERAHLAEDARAAVVRAKTEEMQSSLLSTVSHDLRTPLAAITGAATALRDDGNLPDFTRRELIEAVCDEAERLERLVANLLDMHRVEAGALSLRRDWVPLEELIGSALGRLEARLGTREIEVDLPPDLLFASVDPVLFEQVLVNLLENAAKYSAPGTPLQIRARETGDTLVIEVMDRGPGVPVGRERAVFEKFVRGAHLGVPGAGLGLPICRGIVEAHGGSIDVKSRPGGGASFRIHLPRGEPPPAVPPPSDGRPAALAATAESAS